MSFWSLTSKGLYIIIDAIIPSTCYPHLNFLLFHIWSQWFTYIMALRNASTDHAPTEAIPTYLNTYSYMVIA